MAGNPFTFLLLDILHHDDTITLVLVIKKVEVVAVVFSLLRVSFRK